MSWLAKKLAGLFFLLSSLLILLTAAASGLGGVTIIKRILIGGLVFSILGIIVGQLISYNLEQNKNASTQNKQPNTNSVNQTKNKEQSRKQETAEEMEPLDLAEVDAAEEDVVNLAQEEPEEVAEMVKNMNQESNTAQ